jgi:hypothetical protein
MAEICNACSNLELPRSKVQKGGANIELYCHILFSVAEKHFEQIS